MSAMLPYGRQSVDEDDVAAVAAVLRGDWLTTGPAVTAFERGLAELHRRRLRRHRHQRYGGAARRPTPPAGVGPGTEVVTTPLTFVATASSRRPARRAHRLRRRRGGHRQPRPAGRQGGADRPGPGSWRRSTTPGTRPRWTRCARWPTRAGALLLEDAAHSIGSRYRGRPVGTLADLTTFSFFPTKNMTTAEGGAVATSDPALAQRAAGSTTSAWSASATQLRHPDEGPWHQEVHELGLNYRLPDVLCALGLQPAARAWTSFKARRAEIVAPLRRAPRPTCPACGCRRVATTSTPPGTCTRCACWTAGAARCSSGCGRRASACRSTTCPVYWHPVFEDLGYRRGMCPNAEAYYQQEISLPLFADLTDAEQDRVVDEVRRSRGGVSRVHHGNHFYGHAHILARYAGLAEVPRIWGYVQHGWNIHDGYAVGTSFAPASPSSSGPRRPRGAAGRRACAATRSSARPGPTCSSWSGSGPGSAEPPAPRGHDRLPLPRLGAAEHRRQPRRVRRGDPGDRGRPDHGLPLLERVPRPEGPPAPTSGPASASSPTATAATCGRTPTRDFLDKQLAELRAHRRVVSNRLGSALFYGASVGCEIGVYGDPMILEAERAVLGGMERQKRLWPELHQPAVPRDIASELARVELGTDLVLSRPELISVLGWQHARRAEDGAGPLATEGYLPEDGAEDEGSAAGTDGWTSCPPTTPAR